MILLASVAILILLAVGVVYGCKCLRVTEGFEEIKAEKREKKESKSSDDEDDKDEKDKVKGKDSKTKSVVGNDDVAGLSAKELELFEAVTKGEITDEQIQKLVQNGTIDEKLVEKFLSQLDNLPEHVSEESEKKESKSKSTPDEKKKPAHDDVEGFIGSSYASYY